MNKQTLNEVYGRLDVKAHELSNPFLNHHGNVKCSVTYMNEHYTRNPDGEYDMDLFPIPLVSLENVCQIWVELDKICVIARKDSESLMTFDYNQISNYDYEIYEVSNPKANLCEGAIDVEHFKIAMRNEAIDEVEFAFQFPQSIDGVFIYSFIKFLRQQNFYF